MFEKILPVLRTKYKDLGLSETILKVTAESLVESVKEESEIEAAVEGVKGQLRIYQSFEDRNRTQQKEIADLKKSLDKKPEDKTDGDEDDKSGEAKPEVKEGEEVPAWAKAIIDSNKAILDKQTALDLEKAQKTNSEKLVAKLTELKVGEAFYKLQVQGRTFENDEEIEAYANSVKEAEDAYKQAANIQTLADKPAPIFGQVKNEGDVSPDVQNFIQNKYKTNETSK